MAKITKGHSQHASNYTVIPKTSDALFHLFQHFKQLRHDVAEEQELNTSELEMLLILAHSKQSFSVKDISEQMRLCSQAITKISRALQKRDLVHFEKSEKDRRLTFVLLTDAGEKIAQIERQAREEALKIAIDELEQSQHGNADHADAVRETQPVGGDSHVSDIDKASEIYGTGGGIFSPSFLADSLSMIAERIGKHNV